MSYYCSLSQIKRLVRASILVLLVVAEGYAQSFDLPGRLTFEEARRIFLERNPDLKAARARVSHDSSQARIPSLWPNPSLIVQRNQVSPPTGGIASENTVAIEQPLRYPGEHAAWVAAAEHRSAAIHARYREEAAYLYEELRRRYAFAVVARQKLDVFVEVTDAMRRAAEIGEIRYQEGDISLFERARLRVALATYEDGLEAARQDHRDTRIELAYFMIPSSHAGHHEEEEDLLAVTDSLVYRPEPLRYEFLVERALANRGLVEAAEAGVMAWEEVLEAEKTARLPDLALAAGYRNETQPRIVAHGFTVGLRVGLPVFNQRQPQVQAAVAGVSAGQFEIQQARRAVELDVHDAYERMRSYQRRIEHIREGILADSDGLLRDALYVYEEGEIDLVDLLDAVEASKAARLLRIELVAEYALSRFTMERALGIGPWDTTPITFDGTTP